MTQMFMAEKLIITEEVQKQSNMAFKMRSGNKVSFKNMGSSPVRNMKTGSYEHSFESPAKQGLTTAWDPKSGITKEEHERREQEAMKNFIERRENERNLKYNNNEKKLQEIEEKWKQQDTVERNKPKEKHQVNEVNEKESPTKQKLNKEGEGQDQNKEFNKRGEHVGDWVNGKLVMKPGFKRPVVKPTTPKPLEPHKPSKHPKHPQFTGEWIPNPPKIKKSPNKQRAKEMRKPPIIPQPIMQMEQSFNTRDYDPPREIIPTLIERKKEIERIPSMRAPELPKMPELELIDKRIPPMETYRVHPKPIEMPTHSSKWPKTKKKKKK